MVSSSLLIVDDELHDLIPQAFLHHLLTDAFQVNEVTDNLRINIFAATQTIR